MPKSAPICADIRDLELSRGQSVWPWKFLRGLNHQDRMAARKVPMFKNEKESARRKKGTLLPSNYALSIQNGMKRVIF